MTTQIYTGDKPQKGQVWRGTIIEDVLIQIDSVNPETNTVKAHVSGGEILSYRLDTFTEYYRLEPDVVPTRVTFRYDFSLYQKFTNKDVTAYLLDLPEGNYITCYSRVGQHSNASRNYISSCASASREDYTPLMEELESIGYFLNVVKRMRNTD